MMEHKNLEERALRMLAEKNFTARGFGAKVHITEENARKFLEGLVEKGKITRTKTARMTSYYVQPVVSVDPRMPVKYIPEAKEMKPYDMKAFMRLCEGARNGQTGVV